jgi:hypothetical protein
MPISVTTIATVGYGDIAAKRKAPERDCPMLLAFCGWSVVRLFLAAVKRSHQRQVMPQPAGG